MSIFLHINGVMQVSKNINKNLQNTISFSLYLIYHKEIGERQFSLFLKRVRRWKIKLDNRSK